MGEELTDGRKKRNRLRAKVGDKRSGMACPSCRLY